MLRKNLVVAVVLSAPAFAFAHAGHTDSFMAAITHPFTGWDHLLAMLVLGLLAARYRNENAGYLPTSFVLGMITSAYLTQTGALQAVVPFAEIGIALSLVSFGILAAAKRHLPLATACAVALVFGAFHGIAHGLELPAQQGLVLIGLALSTAALHGLGYMVGRPLQAHLSWVLRSIGVATCLAGVSALLVGA